MDNQENTITCPRCGNLFKNTARYCMRCGYLNPDHPSNQQYYDKFRRNEVEEYEVSGDTQNTPRQYVPKSSKGLDIAFSDDVGSFTLCFILNFLCYLLFIFGISFYYYKNSTDVYAMIGSELSIILLVVSLFSLVMYSTQIVYMKMNKKWYYALIPFVNLYVLSDALTKKKLMNILVFIPVVGQIYLLYLLYQMGVAFKKSGFLTMIVPLIVFPIIAFGGAAFNGVCYISERDSLEKEYSKKQSFWIVDSLVIGASLIMLLYSNAVHINTTVSRMNNLYLYYASKVVMKKTRQVVEKDLYTCEEEDTTMYFYFGDLYDRFLLPFYMLRDPIEAYIKVVVIPGEEGEADQYEYYLSMTDGNNGYAETAFDDIKLATVKKYKALDTTYRDGNRCKFNRYV